MPNDKTKTPESGWIGVDLDGTLAQYDGFKGPDHIGAPIPLMLSRVKEWLEAGREVKILTARASAENTDSFRAPIENWLKEHVGRVLPITCMKDRHMDELWDDRAIQIITNTGQPADGKESTGGYDKTTKKSWRWLRSVAQRCFMPSRPTIQITVRVLTELSNPMLKKVFEINRELGQIKRLKSADA